MTEFKLLLPRTLLRLVVSILHTHTVTMKRILNVEFEKGVWQVAAEKKVLREHKTSLILTQIPQVTGHDLQQAVNLSQQEEFFIFH